MTGAWDRQQQRAAKRANKPPSEKELEELADRAEAAALDQAIREAWETSTAPPQGRP
jgi:hypothetical protein